MERSTIQRIACGVALTACLACGAAVAAEAVSRAPADPPGEATSEIVARNGYTAVEAELPAGAERVFRALTSHDIVIWWVRPSVFDTSAWQGDVRAGGHWQSEGSFRARPYKTEGEFILVDSPRLLVQTWNTVGTSAPPTTVIFRLTPLPGKRTRLYIIHAGFGTLESAREFGFGWRSSLLRLRELLEAEQGGRHSDS
jgi:uncharacterized protein YndB with AHSA1/START domain